MNLIVVHFDYSPNKLVEFVGTCEQISKIILMNATLACQHLLNFKIRLNQKIQWNSFGLKLSFLLSRVLTIISLFLDVSS